MYFTSTGMVAPCWRLPSFGDIWSESRSIKEIWTGDIFERYRTALHHNNYIHGCQICKRDNDCGIFTLSDNYDPYTVKEYPSLIELELSNQCNLECIMCNGFLSSGIRKNRDKLPPLPMIYTQKFKEELKEFIPHLEEIRFNGGEPLAQKMVLEICEMIPKLNQNMIIKFATNGSVYNKRIQKILDTCRVQADFSIDSFIPDRYESIRINGKLNKVLKNLEIFDKIMKKNGLTMIVFFNPMINNWDEMVDAAKICDDYDIKLWFNTIIRPAYLSIKNKPISVMENIYKEINEQMENYSPKSKNYNVIDNFLNSLEQWMIDAKCSV